MTQLFQVGPRQGFYFLPTAHEIIARGKMAPQTGQSPHELIILKVPPLNCVELGTGLSPSALLCFRPEHSRGNAPYKLMARTAVRSPEPKVGTVEQVGPNIKRTSEAVVKTHPHEDLMALGGACKARGIV